MQNAVCSASMTLPSLPPVPDSVHERYLLAWHPGEDAAWLVSHSHGVWRVARDGSGESIAAGDAVGKPTYLREILYFDPHRKAMVHVSLPRADEPLQVSAWDGQAFAPIEGLKGAGPARERDAVGFDARRGVLVHLRVGEEEGTPLTVAELGKDGRWREVGASLPFSVDQVIAGWEASGARVVVLDYITQQVHAWDGESFQRLADFVGPSSRHWFPFTAPRTGNLMLLGSKAFESADGSILDGSALWELAGSTWVDREVGGLEVFGGATHDPVRDVSMVFGPWRGPGTQQRTLAIFDGVRLVDAGLPLYEISGGSVAGPVRFWGKREMADKQTNDRMVVRLYASEVVFERVDGTLVTRASSPTATDAIVSAGGTIMAITAEGVLFRLEDAGWREVAAASDAYGRRQGVCAAGDGRGRVLVVGGRNDYTRKHNTTGFLFDGKAWQSLPAKNIPVVSQAQVIADEARDAWVLVGARDRKDEHDFKVHELVDGKWKSHASTLKAKIVSIGVVAYDDTSKQVFAVATLFDAKYNSKTSLFVYRGAGRWEDCGAVALDGSSAAYDTARRTIVSVNAPELSDLAIGPMLDAAAQGQSPAKAAAGKKVKEEAKVAKKVAKKKVAPPETAHLIRFVKKGVDHYGGLPRGVTAELWPMCGSCGAAMQHVLALSAHDPRLPLQKYAGLAVFVCNSGKSCATWDPESGCNKVLLLSEAQLEHKALAEPPRVKGGPKPSPVIERLPLGYKTRVEQSPETEDVEPIEAESKVGGFPVWVQSEQVPACDKCEKPMRFVAQLMEPTSEVNFGGGDGYVFCCKKEHQAKFLWQQ